MIVTSALAQYQQIHMHIVSHYLLKLYSTVHCSQWYLGEFPKMQP